LPDEAERILGITYAEIEDLTAKSDYICNLLPYNKSTHLILDATFFNQMKQGSYFVSCGAGSVIDFEAIAHKVESGWLAGVAVDSFDIEPPDSSHPLILLLKNNYNVFLTPHIAAGNTQDPVEKRRQDYNNIFNHIYNRPRNYVLVKGAKNQ
jgi:phosphoglycerate dehydrogenase-like enzyme